MKYPELPTDSLYKFMALSGIAILLISLVPFYHAHKLHLEVICLGGDIKTLNTQTEWLSNDLEQLKDEISILKKQTDELNEVTTSEITTALSTKRLLSDVRAEKDKEAEKIEKKLDKLVNKRLQFEEIGRKQKLTSIQIRAKNEEHKYLVRIIGVELLTGALGLICGIFLAIKGFKLWYRKVQVHEDAIIERKAKAKDD